MCVSYFFPQITLGGVIHEEMFVCNIIVFMVLALTSAALAVVTLTGNVPSSGRVGQKFTADFTASSPVGISRWEINPRTISGLVFSSSGQKAMLSGNPGQAGNYSIEVTVYDNDSNRASRSWSFTIHERDSSGGDTSGGESNTGGELSIGGYLSAEHVGTSYPENLYGEPVGKATADGGTPPYTWSVSKGYVPKGMCLGSPNDVGSYFTYNDYTGPYTLLCGMPVLEGTYDFTLKVTDSAGQTAARDFSIAIDGGDIDNISIGGDDYDGNNFFFYDGEYFLEKTIEGGIAEGGVAPYTWSVAAGNLPTGLRLLNGDEDFYEQFGITIDNSSHKAYLKGTPYGAGTFKFILKVTDRDGRSAYREYTLVLDKGDRIDTNANGSETLTIYLPEIDGDLISSSTVGQSYSGRASASGGVAPYTWSVSYGELPEGISLAGSTGTDIQFTGKPTAQGFYNFTLKVTDSQGNSNARTFMIKVAEEPSSSSTAPINDEPATDTPTTPTTPSEPTAPIDDMPTTPDESTDPTNDTPTTPTTPTAPTTDTDTGSNTNNSDSGGGGGGGCNSGITLLGLFAAMFILKKSA